ncbi:hypothetical protein [Jiella marina]|uniref:hypothetical protein n=1 Tax=Jiella sp. LLJ827 TaxID=2917712 RepID=UPI0021009BF0|nr:hypothetical protein [Jiella sp. LLJ827]MCQ0988312.1 hypothetical protein [Jiella sp. LLJ827]
MSKTADYGDVQRALQAETEQILKQIPVSPVTLSMPVDGAGPRICASVHDADAGKVPRSVSVVHDGQTVEIPVEVIGSYEEFKAL